MLCPFVKGVRILQTVTLKVLQNILKNYIWCLCT